MEKKIIGYKLVKQEFYQEASMILYGNNAGSFQLKHVKGWQFSEEDIEKLSDAGVLNLWFEPVYEDSKTELPTINGYKGEIEKNKIKYGCAYISKKWFNDSENRYIKSLTLSSGVEITEEQVNQIRKFLSQ